MTYKAIVAITIACAIASAAITMYHGFGPLVRFIWGLSQ